MALFLKILTKYGSKPIPKLNSFIEYIIMYDYKIAYKGVFSFGKYIHYP